MLRGTDTSVAVRHLCCCNVRGCCCLQNQHSPYVQAAKLTSSLDYQKRNDLQTAISKLEQQIKDDKKRLAELEKARHALQRSERPSATSVAVSGTSEPRCECSSHWLDSN